MDRPKPPNIPIRANNPKRAAIKTLALKGWTDIEIAKQVNYSVELVKIMRAELMEATSNGIHGNRT